MASCFWTELANCSQVCGVAPSGEADLAVTYSPGDAPRLDAATIGIELPIFDDPTVVNLFDLPGATYTLESTNACGGALSLDLSDGILSTSGAQNTGTCPGSQETLAVTITGGTFPFPEGVQSLYDGRLAVSHGSGLAPGGTSDAVNLWLMNPAEEILASSRYYSLVESDVDANSGFVYDREAMGSLVAALNGDGARIVIQIGKGNGVNISFQFSSNFALAVPPPMPTRYNAVVEEHWPLADDPGGLAFPGSPGTIDGTSTVPLSVYAVGPTWMAPVPSIPGDVEMNPSDLDAFFDENRIYRLGIYAGDDGYTNMVRVGTVKLVPDSGGA